jgi:hypothetical protein
MFRGAHGIVLGVEYNEDGPRYHTGDRARRVNAWATPGVKQWIALACPDFSATSFSDHMRMEIPNGFEYPSRAERTRVCDFTQIDQYWGDRCSRGSLVAGVFDALRGW